ncbi:MAG: phosphoribosylglycinamide formyltransferase [Halobacteriovoraceae bacterium]|nr:phosphoribosylglycinamide formyltransferase [Halobacteriovoraceae bacterium]|tara:strand:- start:60 stop:674 length:615 start_codon:yes stop_codon:yes gene_type:complete
MKQKAAILASGRGSNARKILEIKDSLVNIDISLLISNRQAAACLNLEKEYDIQTLLISSKNLSQQEHERLLIKKLREHNISWIFLAGYMKILSSHFLSNFYDKTWKQNKVINIHPSLLPKFKGLNAYQQAFASNDDHSGITIHFVDSDVDSGQIITQKKFEKDKKDSLDDFIQRGLKIEHKLYPQVLKKLDKALNSQRPEELFK